MNNLLENAKEELKTLLAQKSLIDKKIAAIQQTIAILEPTYGQPLMWPSLVANLLLTANELGLTLAIREVLKSRPNTELSPIAVRDHVVMAGYSFDGHANPMAEVHQILKRLGEGDPRFVSTTTTDGTRYKFDPSIPAPLSNRRKRQARMMAAKPGEPAEQR